MDQYALIHEDEDILVADKLGPIPVQPEKSGDPSLQDLLRAELAAKAGGEAFLEAAHRIDRRASGAVAFAKTKKALETLEADFRSRRIGKTYLACVEREPPVERGRLEHRLVWDRRTNKVKAFPISAGTGTPAPAEGAASGGKLGGEAGERAVLDYAVIAKSDRYFLVEVELHTGRHHQIRAQLAAAGFPIRGDIKYGAKRTTRNGLIMLHARRLVLTQPRSREELMLIAPFPASEPLWAAFGLEG